MKLSLLLLATVFLGACNYRIEKVVSGNAAGEQSVPAGQIDFAAVRSALFQPACFECHAASGRNISPNVETYANVKSNLASIKAAIDNNSMPKNRAPLSASQKKLLSDWIAAGAPENRQAGPPNGPPSTSPPANPGNPPANPPPSSDNPVLALDYETVHRVVLQPACIRCHSGGDGAAGVNLDTYQNVLSNIRDVKSTIEDGSMPRRGKLSDQQKDLILRWIAAGAPERTGRPGSGPECDQRLMTKSFVKFVTADLATQRHGRDDDDDDHDRDHDHDHDDDDDHRQERPGDPCAPKRGNP